MDFIRALSGDDLPALRKAPKADLHCHSLFGTRLEKVESWSGKPLRRPPAGMKGLHGMMEYADEVLKPHINSLRGFEFTAESAVQDAIEDGVTLLEMSFAVRAAKLFYEDGVPGFTAFIDSLADRYRYRIDLRPELGFMREDAGSPGVLDLAVHAIDSGVFRSIDLYSHQEACPPEAVRPLYSHARTQGLKLKAHVGEFDRAEEVRRTVEVLELDEVQHGIAASKSKEVMKWLSDARVRLNVCPTSNVMLGGAENLSSHPIRTLYDHGVQVTVNSDDPMIFGQSVSDEFRNLFQAGVFTAEELDSIRTLSLDHSECTRS